MPCQRTLTSTKRKEESLEQIQRCQELEEFFAALGYIITKKGNICLGKRPFMVTYFQASNQDISVIFELKNFRGNGKTLETCDHFRLEGIEFRLKDGKGGYSATLAQPGNGK